MQPSRRAFLLGRPAARTPWQAFCQRLRRLCEGRVLPLPPQIRAATPENREQLLWAPASSADVRQARALCADSGVCLALAGIEVPQDGRPLLWVDPRQLSALVQDPAAPGLWRAQPGVTLGQLAGVGLAQFAQAQPDILLANWYADRASAGQRKGRCDTSGLHAADVLLADGVADTLGPFGATAGMPLRTGTLQRLVPSLFRLLSGSEAKWCLDQPTWPARYRLDALVPADPDAVNLAHLLLGHGGTLAWLESLAIGLPADAATQGNGCTPPAPETQATSPPQEALPPQARALDVRIKAAFDPLELFPDLRFPGSV